jgi:hypothetical protein
MIHRLASFAAAGAVLAAGSVAFGSARCHMVASITAAQEVPPTPGVNGFGCGEFIIDTALNTVTYRIVYSGLTSPETAAHIHGFAPPGVPAGVVHPLPLGSPKVGVWNYPEAIEVDILAGRCYVNIHTVNFGLGEIRGQITTHAAELDPQQETPPIVGLGSRGWAVLNLDKCLNTLSFHIVINSLGSAETAAHIHGLALHGTPAGVLFALPAGSPKIGVWNYPEALEEAIEDGLTYINIHTVVNGAGEIRGQIAGSLAVSDGAQETPPVATPACGCAFLSLDRAGGRLGFDARHFGLVAAESVAHIHGFAPPGVPAGVLFALPPGSPKRGVWAFGAANLLAMLDQRTYFNVHSVAFGAGEIRGQINLQKACLQPGDADYDEDVDFADITAELATFGAAYGLPAYDPTHIGDSDYSGLVDFGDVTTTLANYGRCYQ